MKYRTKPTEWKLDKMSNDELIRLALGKLKQRTIREGDKMDEAFNSGKKDEKLKLLDEVIHQSTVNLKSAKAVAGWAELRKEQLEAEL